MDTLTIILFFVVIPIAVVLFSVALQRLIDSPILVSAIVFVAFLIIALVFTDSTAVLILAAIALAILALISAFLSCLLSGALDRICSRNYNSNESVGDIQNNNNVSGTRSCSRLCCRRRLCKRRFF